MGGSWGGLGGLGVSWVVPGGFWGGRTDGRTEAASPQFQPQLVLVAAGFDAALGEPEVWGRIGTYGDI